jgi:hypothetical protein
MAGQRVGKRGWLLPVVLAGSIGIGIGAVQVTQWWNRDLSEEHIGDEVRTSIWIDVLGPERSRDELRLERFSVDKGKRTFRGTVRFARVPFEYGEVKISGSTGDYVGEITGEYDTEPEDVPNPLGLHLQRPLLWRTFPHLPEDPMLVGGEPGEKCWRERQTINQIFDGYVNLDRYQGDEMELPLRLYGIFAARFYRWPGTRGRRSMGFSTRRTRRMWMWSCLRRGMRG